MKKVVRKCLSAIKAYWAALDEIYRYMYGRKRPPNL